MAQTGTARAMGGGRPHGGGSVVPISDHDEFCEFVHIMFNLPIFTSLGNLLLIQTSHECQVLSSMLIDSAL